MGTAGRVRSTAELNGEEFGRLVEFLSSDARGNALILSDLLALPELCDVRVLWENESCTAAASREDLPFSNLALSAGDEEQYQRLIGDFRNRFEPGQLIYSLIPEAQSEVLARVVEVTSKRREIQMFRELLSPVAPPDSLDSLKARGFIFRALRPSDLGDVRELMEVGDRFAFTEGSFHKGLHWGAFAGRRLVCTVGTHSLGRQATEVGNLVTAPEYRRQGLARACLSLLLGDLLGRTSSAYLSFFAEFEFLGRLFASLGFADPRPFDLVAWRYPGR